MPRTSSFRTAKSSTSNVSQNELNTLIAKKSYELYEKRGRKPGHALDDWLEAERIVKAKYCRK